MVKSIKEKKVFSNSIFNLKNRLYFSKDKKENIHRETTIFTPIFILNELAKKKDIEAEFDKNLYNIKYDYEIKNEHNDIYYKNYKTRIRRIYEVLKTFLKQAKKVITEEHSEELFNFLQKTVLLVDDKMIEFSEFEILFKRLYKIILSINYQIISLEKISVDSMNETFTSLLEKEIINQKKEIEIYQEENFNVNIGFLRDEIYKRFMFNELNLKFYNLLIDLQLLSVDEIMYSGFRENNKINVLSKNEEELEALANNLFYECIVEIDTKKIRFLTDEYPIESLEENFTFEYFDKLKSMDIINVNFEMSEKIDENIKKSIKTEDIEKIKFAIVCQLLKNNLIDNTKKNILKNIRVVGVEVRPNDRHESGINNNIIFIRLPKLDLEVKLELELVVKVFSRADKLVFQYSDIRNTETRLKHLDSFRFSNSNMKFKIPTLSKGNNIFFNNFSKYLNKINDSGVAKEENLNFKFENEKIITNDIVRSVVVNPINIEVIGKTNNVLSKALLKIYLYIYMQCLYLMVNERNKKIDNFIEFVKNLKNFNFDTVRMKMLKYINYYYYSRYNMRDKFELNQKVSPKAKETFNEVEKIINNNYDYLFLSKLSELIYLQILNIFYFNNIVDIEYVRSNELREILKLDEAKEKEFIRNIVNYFGKYKDKFKEDFSFLDEVYEKDEINKKM
jgi:hypothetical protein